MQTLLVLATHSGSVTNVIVCDTEDYALETEKFFNAYCPSIMTKVVGASEEMNAFFRSYINAPNSGIVRACYND